MAAVLTDKPIPQAVAEPAPERLSFEHIGYNLGWDYAAYGMRPPSDEEACVLRGHAEGAQHFRRGTIDTDLFVRKWLQIRFNALLRRRVFDDAVTPQFLHSICSSHCPITRVPLTVGTLGGSDWSVDRIINDGGYTPQNLMMISSAANRIKDGRNLGDVAALCRNPELDTRLRPWEWMRLYSIMQIAYYRAGLLAEDAYHISPIVAFAPPHISWGWAERLQLAFLLMAMHKKCMAKLPKGGSAHHFFTVVRNSCVDTRSAALSHKLLARLRRKLVSVSVPSDVWWDAGTLTLLADLVNHQSQQNRWPRQLIASMDRFKDTQSEACITKLQHDMALSTSGYLVS
ncbi:hypothetical protein [Noviherbaspirillum pedocola]|uniref:Uncharacterized protein n=1 Tax=Noviherbaspirillum pedocola TaxID=2801341 RepID=A0A934STA5_9BURK|nr:hypothetical protein [Noviherbaspirillum pedocola]MBK4736200.1 hypothetical protein [Noviherbaspirillum pedocola]